jgi:predicted metalloprotease with PDZ domain
MGFKAGPLIFMAPTHQAPRRPTGTALALALALASLTTAVTAAECDLDYRVTPRPDLQPAAMEVELRYAAGGRRESVIRATTTWAGITDYAASYSDWQTLHQGQTVQPMAEPHRWRVRHGPNDLVQLRWRVRTTMHDPEAQSPQDHTQMYRTQIGARGFQFFGHGVLASVEHWGDNTSARLCLSLQPFDPTSAVFGSPGRAERGEALRWHATGSPALLRHAFYAGGPMWRLQEREVHGGTLALAARGEFAQLGDADFADAAAKLIDTQRRFWDATAISREPTQWLVLTPNHSPHGNSGGTLVNRTAVLHAPKDFGVGSRTFEFLIAHENLHQWFPRRFGRAGEGDAVNDAQHYWFSEGFTDHYTHRLLLASGLWTLENYAARLNERTRRMLTSPASLLKAREIAPRFFSDREAGQQLYLRGEWLALRWDAALRRAGRGSLTTVLQSLLLPSAGDDMQSAPLASLRVLDALAVALAGTGIDPRADVRIHIEEGRPVPMSEAGWAEALSACLRTDMVERAVWALGFDSSSFTDRVLKAVDPQGPAHAAGLRDGMAVVGFSVHMGDVERDVLIQVREPATGNSDARVRDFVYRPVAAHTQRLPRWQARPGADTDALCKAWMTAR